MMGRERGFFGEVVAIGPELARLTGEESLNIREPGAAIVHRLVKQVRSRAKPARRSMRLVN